MSRRRVRGRWQRPGARPGDVRRTLTLLATALLSGAACAGSGGPESPSAAVEGAAGRRCHYVSDPDDPLSLRDVARTGVRGNISLWGRDMQASDSVEVSVRYGIDGRLDWVRAIRANVAPERARGLAQLLLENVDDRGAEDWGVRILVVGGDVAGVAPSVACEPEQTGGGGVWANAPTTPESARAFHLLRGRQVPVVISLDERGRILDVRLTQGTYNRWVEQFIIDYIRSTSFEPKLHDGVGVPATFRMTIRFPRR
ncbi:MAG: energy transducer TonB family protein [Gemmatimonadota bacterium]